ncbi:MAG: hypothetical protein R3E79_40455 [Caldilineaceae bacterium]
MSDFTVFDVVFPPAAKQRVIVNTDAKNEADDQYAIVQAVLTPSFDLHGIIPAHFGTAKSATSMQDSYDETMLLLRLMRLEDAVRVEAGATHAMPDEATPVDSPGATHHHRGDEGRRSPAAYRLLRAAHRYGIGAFT